MQIDRDEMLRKLIDIQYERNDIEFARGKFRVRGDCVEIWPGVRGIRLSHRVLGRRDREAVDHQSRLSGETIDELERSLHLSGQALRDAGRPHPRGGRRHQAGTGRAAGAIQESQGKLLEAQRLSARTRYDIEMMQEMGYCPGIENYSRPLSRPHAGRARPTRCYDFFPERFSAVRRRIARDGAAGARRCSPATTAARATLVEHGFRLAQRARQSAAEVRRMGERRSTRWCSSRPRRGRMSWRKPAAKSSSR